MEILQAFVLDSDLERLEDLQAEFNLFDVLRIERRELQHSALLAWLLDPRGSHGLRDYFLRRFLSEAAAEAPELVSADVTPLDVDGWKLGEVEVATERHNIDILLIDQNDSFVCLTENKIRADEHSNQLSRYLETVEREYDAIHTLPIFLTTDGMPPEDEDDAERYVALAYEKVANLVDRTLETRGSTIGAGVAGFLEQYADTLRRHVLNTTDNIEELALQIYDNHRVAIDLINDAVNNAKPAQVAKGWDVIDKAVEQCAPGLRADEHHKWYHRYYSPELDEIGDLKKGSGWTESGRILLFEIKYRERRLALMIGPGPEETRKRIYDLAQRDEDLDLYWRRSRNLSKTYHTLYSKPLIGTGGSSQPDYENSKAQIERVIAEFFENDYWPMVNAVRVDFGLSPVYANSASSATINE